jgi:hypothetical protein
MSNTTLDNIRDLEYVNGIIRTFEKLYDEKPTFQNIFQEVGDLIDIVLDRIMEEDEEWRRESKQD